MKPKVCILRSDGTNCDVELAYAFDKFGAQSVFVHVNQLRDNSKKLKDFQIFALPGGFSYGDDIASGKVLAIELVSFLKDELQNFVDKNGIVLGICNGFQTLIRTGLLPFDHLGKMDATLTNNASGHFECRWVQIKLSKNNLPWIKREEILDIAVNHGEGQFLAPEPVIARIESNNLVFARYVNSGGKPTQDYPFNPNNARNAIAGITNESGRIIGLMPHPEKFVDITQHPNWRREKFAKPHGAIIFENLIQFAKSQ